MVKRKTETNINVDQVSEKSYSLPYIGVNVERLPKIVEIAINTSIRTRSSLSNEYMSAFGCSYKTAKEYVNSLINLRVFTKAGVDKFEISYQVDDVEFDLLLEFAHEERWSSFLTYLVMTNPTYEVLREVVVESIGLSKSMKKAEITEKAKFILHSKQFQGSFGRRQTLEAFVRIILKCCDRTIQPFDVLLSNSPALQRLFDKISLELKKFMLELAAAVDKLQIEKPFYKDMSIISIDDIVNYMPTRDEDELAKKIIALRDKGLVYLHATIPSAAAALGVKIIRCDGMVYSAFSLPRSLRGRS